MAKQAINLSMLLVKAQSAYGTAKTDLDATNIIETIGPATLKPNFGMTEIDLVGGSFDQDASIPGLTSCDLSFKVYARSGGSDTPSQFGALLGMSCFTVAEAVDGIFIYTPTSVLGSMVDCTAWGYSGNLDASGAILRKMSSGILIPKWTFEAGKPTVMDITGKFMYDGIPAAATAPTPTKIRTLASAFLGASTLTINGDNDYKVINAEIDMGQEAALTINPAATYGQGLTIVTKRKIKWKAKAYKELPATCDPETALLGKTLGAVTIEYGAVPQKYKWTSAYGQITNITNSDEAGVETWDLEGLFERNDFTITLNTK
jgi:hypothetical protein